MTEQDAIYSAEQFCKEQGQLFKLDCQWQLI